MFGFDDVACGLLISLLTDREQKQRMKQKMGENDDKFWEAFASLPLSEDMETPIFGLVVDDAYPLCNVTSARELFELLRDGRKFDLSFDSEKDAQLLRVRLHQIKKKSEEHMISCGFMDQSQVMALLFVRAGDKNTYRVSLGKRSRSAMKFTMKIVNEDGEKEDD